MNSQQLCIEQIERLNLAWALHISVNTGCPSGQQPGSGAGPPPACAASRHSERKWATRRDSGQDRAIEGEPVQKARRRGKRGREWRTRANNSQQLLLPRSVLVFCTRHRRRPCAAVRALGSSSSRFPSADPRAPGPPARPSLLAVHRLLRAVARSTALHSPSALLLLLPPRPPSPPPLHWPRTCWRADGWTDAKHPLSDDSSSSYLTVTIAVLTAVAAARRTWRWAHRQP